MHVPSDSIDRSPPCVPLHMFTEELASVLPALIDLLKDKRLRNHDLWENLIPYQAEPYGNGTSLGHCVRPDILLTEEGPKVVELDFVPGGRGHILSALETDGQRDAFLAPFASWYQGLRDSGIVYATATDDPAYRETEIFAQALNAAWGTPIRAVNIDDGTPGGVLVDRLFQRSELRRPRSFDNCEVITKEPFLDSKAVFALIWHSETEELLADRLGEHGLAFLRQAFPETYSIPQLQATPGGNKQLLQIADERELWLIKNADVDTDGCWGCRGVVLGQRYTKKRFREALYGNAPNHKDLGARPIVQRFHPSRDWKEVWDRVVSGNHPKADPALLDRTEAESVRKPAEKHVFARLGPFFLLDNSARTVLQLPYGLLTLRQDPQTHGASDSIITAFQPI